MRIGILTGGGDVPGLNACIKAVVNRVVDGGHEVIGIRKGWGGLLTANPDDPATLHTNFMKLDRARVRTVDRSGGTPPERMGDAGGVAEVLPQVREHGVQHARIERRGRVVIEVDGLAGGHPLPRPARPRTSPRSRRCWWRWDSRS